MKTARDNDNPPQQQTETPTALHDVLNRVAGEYHEMPGMCVTRPQAQRLWGLDSTTCDLVLTTLVGRGVVRRTSRGRYGNIDVTFLVRGSNSLRSGQCTW